MPRLLEARAVDQQTRCGSAGHASADSQSSIFFFYNEQPKEEIQKAGKLPMTR